MDPTNDSQSNINILKEVFTGLIEDTIISFPYTLYGRMAYDIGLKFKSDISVGIVGILEVRLQNFKESITKLFSENFIVIWVPKYKKNQQNNSNEVANFERARLLLINTISSVVSIQRRNEYGFNNKEYVCFVNKYALTMLPSLRNGNLAEKCILILLIKAGNHTYVLFRKQQGFYNSFGGLLQTKELAIDFAVSTLEDYFNAYLDAKSYNSIKQVQIINKKLSYRVLFKTFECKCTINVLTFTSQDFERLGINNHPVSEALKIQESKKLIVGDDFIMVGVKSDGKLKQFDKTLYPVANNILRLLPYCFSKIA